MNKEKGLKELTSLKRGDFWIAKLSFNKNNPVAHYIIRIDDFKEGIITFTPVIAGEFIHYQSSRMNHFQLIKKVMNWDGGLSV